MQFIKYRFLFFFISALVIIPGVFSLLKNGLRPSIDFTGGSLLEVKLEKPAESQSIQDAIKDQYEVSSIQTTSGDRFIIKGSTLETEQKNKVVEALQNSFGATEIFRFETIGPTLSKELLQKTLVAVVIVIVFITLYIARQFKEIKYGVCAVLAILHDSLVLLGCFSLFGYFYGVETDVLFVTAVLTTLSFSVHDTIVVYHRIRELKQKNASKSLEEILDSAVTGTLVRSLNNSITIILMLTALSLLGGETIRWFSVALLIGALTGTYSSTFTAVPLLYVWEQISSRRKK